MKKIVLWTLTHAIACAIGFAAGIYALPVLIAPAPPSPADIDAHAANAEYKGEFRRDLKGSDLFHWGQGSVSVSRSAVALNGAVAPGPDYKLYLSPQFLDNKADFLRLKSSMVRVGDVKTFDNFIVPLPATVDIHAFNTVVVWCETFSQFITAAKYR
jgi:hypothetical protein